jgi:MOSC domain-containing protein YiiM
MADMKEMTRRFAHQGRVEWLGVRPQKRARVVSIPFVEAIADTGLTGDHYAGKPGSSRQVTLIQSEHLVVVAHLLGEDEIDPALLRRNIVVSRINLRALAGLRFQIGDAVLEGAGTCPPCSRMEETLGDGGYNAMRGHGGIKARIVESGRISVGDVVSALPQD